MSYYAIMAIGLTMVIITGGIDISVGSIMALAALGGAAALRLSGGCSWIFDKGRLSNGKASNLDKEEQSTQGIKSRQLG